jgi:hypothetical protein
LAVPAAAPAASAWNSQVRIGRIEGEGLAETPFGRLVLAQVELDQPGQALRAEAFARADGRAIEHELQPIQRRLVHGQRRR